MSALFSSSDIAYTIELRGVYDGTSVYVLTDGTRINRWKTPEGEPIPGYEHRAATVDAFLAGEEPNGRWF